MEITGKIIQVLPTQDGVGKSGQSWKLQGYVLETQEQYPRKVQFELFGEERIKNNPCNIDDVVTVSLDIESRAFNGRWYTSIRAWKVQQANATNATPAPTQPVARPVTQQTTAPTQNPVASPYVDAESEELPF